MWVRFGKVLDYLRLFFGPRELGTALALVLEIDMDTTNSEFIRGKIGVRDLHKIPTSIEISIK